MAAVLLVLSIIATVVGTACAASAQRFPAHQGKLEQLGGGLFVGGIALLGFSFPYI